MFNKKSFIFILVFLASFVLLNAATGDVAKTSSWKNYIDMGSLMNILISFLIALVTVATKALSSYLNNLSKQKQAETDNILLKNAFGFANNLIQELILAESDKVKKLIDKILKDGKVTKEEKEEAVRELTNIALQILGDKGLGHLSSFLGDAEGWVKKKVEAFLSLKLSKELESGASKK